jgi:hypothetical protein
MGSPPDTSFAVDTLGNARFAGTMSVATSDASAALTVGGDICATGAIGACSDERYKTDVRSLSGALDRVMRLRGVTYRWKQDDYPQLAFDDRKHIGLIAQEVEPLFPEMVMTDDDGYKSVDYSRLTPVLVEAMKEQQVQIGSLERCISEQQQQIEELRKLVRQLAGQGSEDSMSRYGMK